MAYSTASKCGCTMAASEASKQDVTLASCPPCNAPSMPGRARRPRALLCPKSPYLCICVNHRKKWAASGRDDSEFTLQPAPARLGPRYREEHFLVVAQLCLRRRRAQLLRRTPSLLSISATTRLGGTSLEQHPLCVAWLVYVLFLLTYMEVPLLFLLRVGRALLAWDTGTTRVVRSSTGTGRTGGTCSAASRQPTRCPRPLTIHRSMQIKTMHVCSEIQVQSTIPVSPCHVIKSPPKKASRLKTTGIEEYRV